MKGSDGDSYRVNLVERQKKGCMETAKRERSSGISSMEKDL